MTKFLLLQCGCQLTYKIVVNYEAWGSRGCFTRGLFSVGNLLSELLINTEMVFSKGNQMSIEGIPFLVKGTTPLSLQKATLAPCLKNNSLLKCVRRKESVLKKMTNLKNIEMLKMQTNNEQVEAEVKALFVNILSILLI